MKQSKYFSREIANLGQNKRKELQKNMNIKRFISGMVLFPIVAIIIVFGNKYIVDIAVSIVAIMSLHEFYKAFRTSR